MLTPYQQAIINFSESLRANVIGKLCEEGQLFDKDQVNIVLDTSAKGVDDDKATELEYDCVDVIECYMKTFPSDYTHQMREFNVTFCYHGKDDHYIKLAFHNPEKPANTRFVHEVKDEDDGLYSIITTAMYARMLGDGLQNSKLTRDRSGKKYSVLYYNPTDIEGEKHIEPLRSSFIQYVCRKFAHVTRGKRLKVEKDGDYIIFTRGDY